MSRHGAKHRNYKHTVDGIDQRFDEEIANYMGALTNSTVFRAGVTARSLKFETQEISFHTGTSPSAVAIRFRLAASGGTTSVLLQIGLDDLRMVLEQVAKDMPEESVSMLSDSAILANERILERLQDARKVEAHTKELARSHSDKLEHVAEFISKKYYAAPPENDEREASVDKEINEVLDFLRRLAASPTLAR